MEEIENKSLENVKNNYEKKFDFFSKYFGISEIEFKKIYKDAPNIMSFKDSRLIEKSRYYCDKFNLSKNDFKKMLKICPNLLSYNENSVDEKVENLKILFGFTDSQIISYVKILPAILNFNIDSLIEKKEFYKDYFNIDDKELYSMMKLSLGLLTMKKENIDEKVKFYENLFGLKKDECLKIVKSNPTILNLKEKAIYEKVENIKTILSITDKEVTDIIKQAPSILFYNEETIKRKCLKLNEMGIKSNYIAYNPNIITSPENTLKLRYAILCKFFDKETILKRKNWSLTNQSKTYARIVEIFKQIEEKNNKSETKKPIILKISQVLSDEKGFRTQFGVTSDEIMKEYPLTKDIAERIISDFNERSDVKLYLTEDEIKFLEETEEKGEMNG